MFTVFAVIFGSGSGSAKPGKLKVIVLDQDETRSSVRLLSSLKAMENLEVTLIANTITDSSGPQNQSIATTAENRGIIHDAKQQAAMTVLGGNAAAAVILPEGLEASMAQFGQADRPAIELIYDPANPLAEQMLAGVLQASAFSSSPGVLMEKGLEQFRIMGGPFSPLQEAAASAFKTLLSNEPNADQAETGSTPGSGGFSMTDGIVRIESHSARVGRIPAGPLACGNTRRSRNHGAGQLNGVCRICHDDCDPLQITEATGRPVIYRHPEYGCDLFFCGLRCGTSMGRAVAAEHYRLANRPNRPPFFFAGSSTGFVPGSVEVSRRTRSFRLRVKRDFGAN